MVALSAPASGRRARTRPIPCPPGWPPG